MDQTDKHSPEGHPISSTDAPSPGPARRVFVLTLVAAVAFVSGVVIQATFNPLKPKTPTRNQPKQPVSPKKPKVAKKNKTESPGQKQPDKNAIRVAELMQERALLTKRLLEARQKADHLDKAYDRLSKTTVEQTGEIDRLQVIVAGRSAPVLGASAAIVPKVAAQKVKTVGELREPDNQGFEFLSDTTVIDLRTYLRASPDKVDKRVSPVSQRRYLVGQRSDQNQSTVQLEFATRGSGLDVRCLTHQYELFAPQSALTRSGVEYKHAYQMLIHLGPQKNEKPLNMIVEGTYWNAFQDDQNLHATMKAHKNTAELTLIILLPKDKPMKSSELSVREDGARMFKKYQGEGPRVTDDDLVFSWTIIDPKPKAVYRAKWNW